MSKLTLPLIFLFIAVATCQQYNRPSSNFGGNPQILPIRPSGGYNNNYDKYPPTYILPQQQLHTDKRQVSGGNGGGYGGGGQKPGSCYRPNNSGGYHFDRRNDRKRRDVEPKFGYGGGWNNGPIHGGNIGKPPGPGPIHGGNNGGIGYCYRDYDCPGNKKCCSGACRTPAFVG